MDADFGLIYLRVPTWAPFRLQFYCNGHSWLARQLAAEGIAFTAADNAFVRHRRLDARPGAGGHLFARSAAPPARSLCGAVLPGARRVRAVLSLEPDAARICHRYRVPLRRHAGAALRATGPRVGAQRQGAADCHLPRPP